VKNYNLNLKKKVLLLTIVLLISLITGIFPFEKCIANSNFIYVDDDGGANYTNIQSAIDNSNNGDTIYVYSGTYYENIVIDKDIILTGENQDTTIIDGGNNNYVLYAHGISGYEICVSISGFNIRNAGGTGNDCIAFSYVNDGNIYNNKILNSDKSDGIQLDHCNRININDNQISGNSVSGISLTRSNNNFISDNVIQNNQKGIYFWDSSSNNEIFDNTISGNSQYGFHIQVSSIQSKFNFFYKNDIKMNGVNAQDPYDNYWSKDNQGNYWDDYDDYDSDENGIGDSPYIIPGGSNQDNYPLGYFLEPEPPGSNQQPTAYQPTIYPNPAQIGDIISFSGSGSDPDGYIEEYYWSSSINGFLSTNSEFSKSSLNVGTHTVYFKVKDNEGLWSSQKTTTLTISEIQEEEDPIEDDINIEPVATIDFISPNPSVYKQKITLKGHGSDEDGTITGFKWLSSIDGFIGNKETINITDLSIGYHTIYFQVKDNKSEWSKQVTECLIISQYPLNNPPVPIISSANLGNTETPIKFVSNSYDDDGEITEYLWDFNDGSIDYGQSITHKFLSPGNYSVSLTVTDNDGESSTDTILVKIIQSSNDNSNSGGLVDFQLEIPFPIIIIIYCSFVVIGISIFLIWLRRKKIY